MTVEHPIAEITLRCGTLRLAVEQAEMPLDELCGYASRRSRKRGFVFVSKVLGKHFPVRPRAMAEVYRRLASMLTGISGPAVLIALAETATGLGQGIYEEWLRATGRDVLFMHTTRYHLRHPIALEFEESHSHATRHLLYNPIDPDLARLFRQAGTLVLVDDELSTGRTLANLAEKFRQINPGLSSVHFVCLTDWLGSERRAQIERQIGLPTTVHSLLRGSFAFEENPSFEPGPIPAAVGRGDFKDAILGANHGRFGVRGLLQFDLEALIDSVGLRTGQRILVLGNGEFAHAPYLFAQRLENLGFDVSFQSTTRSPLLADRDITSVLEFGDNYDDGITNYLYNVSDRRYDRILIGYETRPLPAAHALPSIIGATPVFFAD